MSEIDLCREALKEERETIARACGIDEDALVLKDSVDYPRGAAKEVAREDLARLRWLRERIKALGRIG